MIYGATTNSSSTCSTPSSKSSSNFNYSKFKALSKVSNFLKFKSASNPSLSSEYTSIVPKKVETPNYENYLDFVERICELKVENINGSNDTFIFPAYASSMLKGIHDEIAHRQLKQNFIDYIEYFVENLFVDEHSNPAQSNNPNLPKLSKFLKVIITRTKIGLTTLAASLFYLNKLSKLFPFRKKSSESNHRLLLASIITASKVLNDDTFDNKAWTIVSNGLFVQEEVNKMETEFLYYLGYVLYIRPKEWFEFVADLETKIRIFATNQKKTVAVSWKGPLVYELKVWDEFEDSPKLPHVQSHHSLDTVTAFSTPPGLKHQPPPPPVQQPQRPLGFDHYVSFQPPRTYYVEPQYLNQPLPPTPQTFVQQMYQFNEGYFQPFQQPQQMPPNMEYSYSYPVYYQRSPQQYQQPQHTMAHPQYPGQVPLMMYYPPQYTYGYQTPQNWAYYDDSEYYLNRAETWYDVVGNGYASMANDLASMGQIDLFS